MNNLCIIPARGGSKRIPRKNIKEFLGKPIISYSIKTALECGLFNEVIVSTDDTEVAACAKLYGADVPFMRTEYTSNDYATLADVIREVLGMYANIGKHFDNVCLMLATAPLLDVNDVIAAYDKLIASHFSSIIPVVQFSYPILRSYRIDESGELQWNWPEYAKTRSQDLPQAFHDSGTFYWHKVTPWLEGKVSRGFVILDETRVQDIDTNHDWKIAELKYKVINEEI